MPYSIQKRQQCKHPQMLGERLEENCHSSTGTSSKHHNVSVIHPAIYSHGTKDATYHHTNALHRLSQRQVFHGDVISQTISEVQLSRSGDSIEQPLEVVVILI